MRERARSVEDKAQRSEDLLSAAEELALELGGVRFVTIAAVTERAGLHRTGVRRYYASKEELLLELAERGWGQWRDLVKAAVDGQRGLDPERVGTVVAETISSLSVFCDLLSHTAMSLEGDVDIERARRYKTNAVAAHTEIAQTLDLASTMSGSQISSLLTVAITVGSSLWHVSHPTPTLATLYEQMPAWGHAALDFQPRLRHLLRATAVGLSLQP